jgi:hypothetical protein
MSTLASFQSETLIMLALTAMVAVFGGALFALRWARESRQQRETQARLEAQRINLEERRLHQEQVDKEAQRRLAEEESKRQAEIAERRLRQEQVDKEEQRRLAEEESKRQAAIEAKRLDEARTARWDAERQQEWQAVAASAGAGSGGYIVVDMPEKDRPFFHDLLKGFEDYAKLKGYDLSFSIDSSFEGRIAFKFTVKNDGVMLDHNVSAKIFLNT